jgi:hypothetical protein
MNIHQSTKLFINTLGAVMEKKWNFMAESFSLEAIFRVDRK